MLDLERLAASKHLQLLPPEGILHTGEFDHERVCREVRLVLRPSGCFVVVTPGRSALADAGLRLLTGERARADFCSRRSAILPALRENFKVQMALSFPSFGGSRLRLYDALQLVTDP